MTTSYKSVYICHLCDKCSIDTWVYLRQCFVCANYVCKDCIKFYIDDKDVLKLFKEFPYADMDPNDFDFLVQNNPKLKCYDCYIHYENPEKMVKPNAYKFDDLIDMTRYNQKIGNLVAALKGYCLIEHGLNQNNILFQADVHLMTNSKYNIYALCDVYTSDRLYPKHYGNCRIYEFNKDKNPALTFYQFCSLIILFEHYNDQFNEIYKVYYKNDLDYYKQMMVYQLDLVEMDAIQNKCSLFPDWSQVERIGNDFDLHTDKNPSHKTKEYHNHYIGSENIFIWKFKPHNWLDFMINGSDYYYYVQYWRS